MVKRKILTTLLIAAITVPSLLITALAVEPSMVRSGNDIALLSGFRNCRTCYSTTSKGIKNHPDQILTCGHDIALRAEYSCVETNYAKTKLTGCSRDEGYKDNYVYERDSSGDTKTDYKYTNEDGKYPFAASVNPINTYIPVCVRHEVAAPNLETAETTLHTRNYE